MILCSHWQDIGRDDGGRCHAGRAQGRPTRIFCEQRCTQRDGQASAHPVFIGVRRAAPTPSLAATSNTLACDLATERICKDCELALIVSEQGAAKLKAAALRRKWKHFVVLRSTFDAIVAEHPSVKS